MRRAAAGAAIRHCPFVVALRLGASGPTPRASVSPIPALVPDDVDEHRRRSCGAATADSSKPGPVDSRAVAGRRRRHLTASASATRYRDRRPPYRCSRTPGRGLAAGSPPGATPVAGSVPTPRNTASERRRKSVRMAASVLWFRCCRRSFSCLLLPLVSFLVCSLFPSCDPNPVKREAIPGRLARAARTSCTGQRPRPKSRLGSQRRATGAACGSGSFAS